MAVRPCSGRFEHAISNHTLLPVNDNFVEANVKAQKMKTPTAKNYFRKW